MKTNEYRNGLVLIPDDFKVYDWLKEMNRLGLNTLGVHNGHGIGDRLYERLGETFSSEFRQATAENGVEVEYELHTGSSLLPRDLFQNHPDYFRFDKSGVRSADYNWCTSSSGGRQLIAQNVQRYGALLKPDTHRYFFWGDDNRGWCHCSRCCRWDAADQELEAANVIAAALETQDLDAQVAFLAYGQSFKRPSTVRPRANVFLEYAPIQRCFLHAIDDVNCADNRVCWQTLTELLELFPVATCHVLEYWLDPAFRSLFNADIMAADIRAYRSLGIRSITTFATRMDRPYLEAAGLKNVQIYAQLLTDMNSV